MMRRQRVLPLLALSVLPVLMTACGTERPTVTARDDAHRADRNELAARARTLGTQLDMVYVTEVPGYKLASQSVGVHGDHGFDGTYVASHGGGNIRLAVDQGTIDADHCAAPGIHRSEGQKVSCASDRGLWYRTSSSGHEYAFQDGPRVIRLSADRATVKGEALYQAAHRARKAGNAELDAVLPKTKGSGSGQKGTERGDLPTTGDGAPQDPVGVTEGTSG
ncbi:hypothetical protein [Streptomyces sp. NPDC053427]|uniref:hypothetical protein n=1 Tax=Streptomyces sp. NPDC053427 TaxID=3365701 RepID=UPI0037CDEFF3